METTGGDGLRLQLTVKDLTVEQHRILIAADALYRALREIVLDRETVGWLQDHSPGLLSMAASAVAKVECRRPSDYWPDRPWAE